MQMREMQVRAKDLPLNLRDGLDVDDETTCQVRVTVVSKDAEERLANIKRHMQRIDENPVRLYEDPVELVRRQRDQMADIINDDDA